MFLLSVHMSVQLVLFKYFGENKEQSSSLAPGGSSLKRYWKLLYIEMPGKIFMVQNREGLILYYIYGVVLEDPCEAFTTRDIL